MKKVRFSEEQIMEILKLTAAGTKIADVYRNRGIPQRDEALTAQFLGPHLATKRSNGCEWSLWSLSAPEPK